MKKVVVVLDEKDYDFLDGVALVSDSSISDVIKRAIHTLIKAAENKKGAADEQLVQALDERKEL